MSTHTWYVTWRIIHPPALILPHLMNCIFAQLQTLYQRWRWKQSTSLLLTSPYPHCTNQSEGTLCAQHLFESTPSNLLDFSHFRTNSAQRPSIPTRLHLSVAPPSYIRHSQPSALLVWSTVLDDKDNSDAKNMHNDRQVWENNDCQELLTSIQHRIAYDSKNLPVAVTGLKTLDQAFQRAFQQIPRISANPSCQDDTDGQSNCV